MTQDFDTKLLALRQRFIDNFPQNEDKDAQFAAFSALTLEEKLDKVTSTLELLDEKENLLLEKKTRIQSNDEIAEIEDQLKAVHLKREVFKHKLELLKNSELESSKRDKMKRQLTQLEMKRCKNLLDKKDCNKIEAKIAHKKEIFKRVFG